MKKLFNLISALLVIVSLSVTVSAATIKTVDSIMYSINSNGTLVEKYTGWTTSKSTGNKYYYKNGERLTGVQVINGSRYVFDSKGIYLLNRDATKEKYSVIFNDNYNIHMTDGKISFSIKVNDLGEKKYWEFDGGPYFSLYTYTDGKWKAVPYKYNEFDDYAVGIANETEKVMNFTQSFSAFNYDFTSGIYRVKVKVGNGDRDGNGRYIWTDVRGEFNIK